MNYKLGDLVGTSDDPTWKIATIYRILEISKHGDFVKLIDADTDTDETLWSSVEALIDLELDDEDEDY